MGIVKTAIKVLLRKMGYTVMRNRTNVKEAYFCRALTGLSGYNISINSDMTVSCACSDSENQGIIGDLRKQTFKEIFEGNRANRYRELLSEGKLPTAICKKCVELTVAPLSVCGYYKEHYGMPVEGIMIENCSSCNYHCKYCERKNITAHRLSNIISVEDMRKIANELKENGIKLVSLFKLGEPFLDKDVFAKIKILKEANPSLKLYTSTNGMLLNTEDKREAALYFDRIDFSVDGINTETANKYQAGADFDKIMDNVKAIAEMKKERGLANPVLVWKYVVFSWNDSLGHIEKAFAIGKEIGFDKILFTFGLTHDGAAVSQRYYDKSFIPLGKYKYESYIAGHGMTFNL